MKMECVHGRANVEVRICSCFYLSDSHINFNFNLLIICEYNHINSRFAMMCCLFLFFTPRIILKLVSMFYMFIVPFVCHID